LTNLRLSEGNAILSTGSGGWGEQALGWDVVTGTDPFVAKDGVTAGQAAQSFWMRRNTPASWCSRMASR
jgi:hypothetical protein